MEWIELCRAGCADGCDPCFRSCAVATIKLSWWRGEYERLLRERPPQHHRNHPSWMADFQEAREAVERLTRDRLRARPHSLGGQAGRPKMHGLKLVRSEHEQVALGPPEQKTRAG